MARLERQSLERDACPNLLAISRLVGAVDTIRGILAWVAIILVGLAYAARRVAPSMDVVVLIAHSMGRAYNVTLTYPISLLVLPPSS